MSIESLKQQARKHEQNEDWSRALEDYRRALAELARDDQVDIGLHNRVGDLYVRVGQHASAVEHYEKAVDLYREAFLPNNAIAVCKKIIRSVPNRHRAYLVIGQIRAEQGFIPDARTNFLTYAERMQHDGELDESFRALIEFCDLAPDDVGVRISVADQMASNGRREEAVEQYVLAYRHLERAGEPDVAQQIAAKIHELDPAVDPSAPVTSEELPEGASQESSNGPGGFDGISFEPDAFGEEGAGGLPAVDQEVLEQSTADASPNAGDHGAIHEGADAGAVPNGDQGSEGPPTMDFGAAPGEEDEAAELPMMDFGAPTAEEEEAVELPTMGFGAASTEEDEAVELPVTDFDFSPAEEEEESAELPMMDFDFSPAEEEEESVELPLMDFDAAPTGAEETVGPPAIDFGTAVDESVYMDTDLEFSALDAVDSLELGQSEEPGQPSSGEAPLSDAPAGSALENAFEEAPSAPVERPEPFGSEATEEEPAGAHGEGDYVDFGAMILGDGPGPEGKSTRFKVAYQEPSGNEEADFDKMLSQFKEKVSETLDPGDVRAHHDLGTAYKEMGLHEEAISSFQAALRASAAHLPTYEVLGQTFIEMGRPEAALKTLERAVEAAGNVEDELVGIYYYLGRAHEALENKDSAVEFYDRVFALDINFADVTERLRELR